jgi:hypothetical protein
VDPGWDADRFPDHAVCYKTQEEIKAIYLAGGDRRTVTTYPKPANGILRIVGTGHSFMAPGYRALGPICKAVGFQQPILTHTGGGITGSARYKWEQENGIFQFDRQPAPKLLAAIANGQWEAMMWGPYFNDRAAYYSCWIDFCLKYNPGMTFYLSDAWPSIEQMDERPVSESELTSDLFVRLGKEQHSKYADVVNQLNKQYGEKVFIMPTCDAMVLAVQYYHRGELPGVEGVHAKVGGKERSLWRDSLGHLGPGLGHLEGYVFYATLYARSPELIESDVDFGDAGEYPSRELDRVFRKIAWEAVTTCMLSGVTDKNGNGIGDSCE